MSQNGGPPQGVPTLTEVVQWPDAGAPQHEPRRLDDSGSAPVPIGDATAVLAADVSQALPSEAQLTQAILVDLQRQIDLMLDYRMREMLAPLLARATDGLVRDARHELASTLRDIVARAVAQEMSRHRIR